MELGAHIDNFNEIITGYWIQSLNYNRMAYVLLRMDVSDTKRYHDPVRLSNCVKNYSILHVEPCHPDKGSLWRKLFDGPT